MHGRWLTDAEGFELTHFLSLTKAHSRTQAFIGAELYPSMATELLFPSMPTARRSQCAEGYQVIAELDEASIWYRGADCAQVERAYYLAALRTVLRRAIPRLSPPVSERVFK